MPTKSQEIAADIAALLRSRNSLLWVTTREEARVERFLIEAAASVGYAARIWVGNASFHLDAQLRGLRGILAELRDFVR
jgi:hypothetical protein